MPYKTMSTCHPDKLQKSADGKCDNCWRRHVREQFRAVKNTGLFAGMQEVASNIEAALENVETVTEGGNAMHVSKTVTEKVSSLEDLVRVCGIDTSVWEIDRYTVTAHQQASVPRVTGQSGNWKRESTEVVTAQLFGVKAWLKRKAPIVKAMERLRVELIEDIRKTNLTLHTHRSAPDNGGGHLFEFSPFDLHLGKYAWDEETVANYDLDIASDLFNKSLDYLLTKALAIGGGKLDRALCVFGNDVSHVDSKRGQTTAGTQMDVDTRYVKVYRRIVEIHRRAINVLRGVAPVDVVIVPGNHDELTSFHLGEVIAALYENDQHVTVNNGPRLRKYYEYGVNMLGFTHGDSERVAELPLTMAREQPQMWARCPEREFHMGHLHIKESWEHKPIKPMAQDGFSTKGVRVRRLSSLSAHDAWHTKHAYMDRRACDAFVYHKDAGFTANLSFNVDHFTGKATSK